jgi:SAM-dependent methyltransferase
MIPVAGWDRSGPKCHRTYSTVISGIGRVHPKGSGRRLLDIGCGSGSFTVSLGRQFEEVHGVDVNADSIAAFKSTAPSHCRAHLINAADLPFPANYFDTIITIETLEHVCDLQGVAQEAARVLRQGGELVITVPNRWYPVEGHGGVIFGRHFSRIPLVTWFPWIHSRVGAARVFTVRSLDRLFVPLGFRRRAFSYLWPTFEHGGGGSGLHGRIQKMARPLYPLMRAMERTPLRFLGSSVVVRYEKVSSSLPMAEPSFASIVAEIEPSERAANA